MARSWKIGKEIGKLSNLKPFNHSMKIKQKTQQWVIIMQSKFTDGNKLLTKK